MSAQVTEQEGIEMGLLDEDPKRILGLLDAIDRDDPDEEEYRSKANNLVLEQTARMGLSDILRLVLIAESMVRARGAGKA